MGDIYSFVPLVAMIVNLFLTALVYFYNVKSSANRGFAYWSLSLVIWSLGAFLAFSATSEKSAWFACYINAAGLIFIPSTFYSFVLNITESKEKWHGRLRTAGFVLSLGFLFVALFTKGFFANVVQHTWGWLPEHGWAGLFYIPFLLFFSYNGIYLLWKARRNALGAKHNQLSYILIGTIIGYLGGTINIFTVTGVAFYPVGYLFNVLYTVVIAYAILVYRLMDVVLVVRKIFSYATLLTIMMGIYLTCGFLYEAYVAPTLSPSLMVFFMMAATGFTMLMFLTIREKIEKGFNVLIFAGRYNYQEMLQSLGKVFVNTVNMDELADSIVNSVTQTIGIERASFMLLERGIGGYVVRNKFGLGNKTKNNTALKKDSEIVKFLSSGKIFLKEEVNRNPLLKRIAEDASSMDVIESLGIYLSIPIMGKEGLIGILNLDRKISGRIYTHEDIGILLNLSYEIAIAVENAGLFQMQKEFVRQLIQSEKMATVGQLTAGIVHDIRNPLSVVMGRAQIMLAEKKLDPETLEDLDAINEQAIRINNIVNNLLRLSKSSKLKFSNISVNDVINESIDLVENQKFMKGIIIVAHLEDAIPLINGDAGQLEQVFMNLINNARDAMPEGGKLVITTHFKEGSMVEIRVKDSGDGIKPEDKKMIFQSFFTTREKGIGLGLFIVKNIISAHAGSIEVNSNPGGGTEFVIGLPVGIKA